MVKRNTRSSTSPAVSTRRRHGVAMELMMECQDDDLSPSQINYMRKCRLEYDKAMAMIKEAQTKARLGKATVSIQKVAGKPPTAMPIPSSNAVTPKQQKMPNRSTSPDVIIVGETPATPKSTMPVAAAKTNVPVARPPVAPAPQQIVVRPLQNVQSTRLPHSATVLKVIPVTSQPLQLGYQQQQNVVSPQQAVIRPAYNQRFITSQNSASSMLLNSALQAKRNLENMQDSDGPLRKKPKKVETNEVGNWVPLDEYYYGKMEGDPSYVEEKGEFRFKCWYCFKMLYNNVKAMMHIQGHIDSGKQHNLDLSDLTQCKHCYKQFDTPFEMQTHVEKVHMHGANVLLCRICERDHESRNALTHHMRQNHTACEMPYICQLCSFRSSMYSDVVDHFKKKHDSSQHILCLYCLKIFKVKFVSQGWGQTQTYYGHLLKHQSKTATRKCTLCRLTFFNTSEVKSHKKKDHTANHKGILGTNNRYTTPGQVMIKVPESGLHGKQQSVKSLNAPAVSKVLDFGGTRFPTVVNYLTCMECKMSMGTPDHFKKHIECSMCRFATSCSIAYANHMMGFHSGQMSSLNLNIPWERRMESPMYCLCGFSSRYGNRIANHLVYCTKRTCYRSRQHTPGEDGASDEEVGDPRRKPGASLLDVLGLVKKRTVATTDQDVTAEIRRGSKEEDRSIPPFRVNSSKVRSEAVAETSPPEDSTAALPKEKASPPDSAAPDVDNIPPELKGSRKWKTVKIKDQEVPSKASVFLGAKDEPKKEEEGGENEETEVPCTEKDDSREVTPEDSNSPEVDNSSGQEEVAVKYKKKQKDETGKKIEEEIDAEVEDQSSKVSPNDEAEAMEVDDNAPKSSDSSKNKVSKITAEFDDDDDDNDDVKSLGNEEIDELLKETSDTSDMMVDEADAADKEKTGDVEKTNLSEGAETEDIANTSESTGIVDKESSEKEADNVETEEVQVSAGTITAVASGEVEQSAVSSPKTTCTMENKGNAECQKESKQEVTEMEKISEEKGESEEVTMETDTQDLEEKSDDKVEQESLTAADNDVQEISTELRKSEEFPAQMQEKCTEEISETLEKSEEHIKEPSAQNIEKETKEELEKISDNKCAKEMNERGENVNRKLDSKSESKSEQKYEDEKSREQTVSQENTKERSPDKGERSKERSSSENRHSNEDRGQGSKSDSKGSRSDSRSDHHHGDRSHSYHEKRSHDSRYESGSHHGDGRSHNRYHHEDRSHDYKRGQDYQRDRYHGGSYNDRRDHRGYQDNRNYHGNHPYDNRGRDDRRRDGHYDNYNRNQGQYHNRGGRGGYGYRGGYQGSYR